MDEYEEIPTADEDDNNVIDNANDHNQDPHMEQVIYMYHLTKYR